MGIVAAEPERIEIGEKMTAHPKGADQHDHPQMIEDEALAALTAEIDHMAGRGAGRGCRIRGGTRFERVPALLEQPSGLVPELVEIGSPALVDRGWIIEIPSVEVFDETAIAAVKKGALFNFQTCRHRSALHQRSSSSTPRWPAPVYLNLNQIG